MSDLRIFGVRHHGPGSARSLLRALDRFDPHAILIEGPPEANDSLHWALHEEMQPPVALLVYAVDEPGRAVFYPFATFSPEWIALRFGLTREHFVAFMDLPQLHRLAVPAEIEDAEQEDNASDNAPGDTGVESRPPPAVDPIAELAQLAGYADSERWWDHLVESRRGGHEQIFDAITDAMAAMREKEHEAPPDTLQLQREAHMRKVIRNTIKAGHERIAVVCGAWHAPALRDPGRKGLAGKDNALLKGLPRRKTATAWTPWSYERLALASGYGAGVASPAYYHMLWTHERDPGIHWMTRVARLLRGQDLDASSAHVIESVRLANTLAAMRGRPVPGLEELDEAVLTVMCFGNQAPMQLIRRKLVIGDRLGQVPEEAPSTPLQQDLQQLQKRLRMPPKAIERDVDLDLRKPLDLERSHLLHRLRLLGVNWGALRQHHGARGTFHEVWRVQWEPGFAVSLIEASRWGNTVELAAIGATLNKVAQSTDLAELTGLLDDALLANLPRVVTELMAAIRDQSAVAADVLRLLAALPALARVSRYGSVRRTDAGMVLAVSDSLVIRICAGLPTACGSLNDEAAAEVYTLIHEADAAIALLQRDQHQEAWRTALRQLADSRSLHGLMAGKATRLLHDTHALTPEAVALRFSRALSTGNDPANAAAWAEGFLRGSGLLLIHDQAIWTVLDEWVCGLSSDAFTNILPLLRRTFATFAAPERRQMGERVKADRAAGHAVAAAELDAERAALVLPILATILGVEGDVT